MIRSSEKAMTDAERRAASPARERSQSEAALVLRA